MRRPNLFLILMDQWRFDTLGANGGSICRTPNIDALSRDGVRCLRAYTPIGLCSPTRASLLTGLYPHAHGMLNNCHEEDAILSELPSEVPTFTEALAANGYRLGYAGKWHVGLRKGPDSRGFKLAAASKDDYRNYRTEQGLPGDAGPPSDTVFADLGRWQMPVAGTDPTPPDKTYTSFIVDETLRLLDRLVEDDAPFLLVASVFGPHHPYFVPEPYASMYDPGQLDPWPSFAENFENKPAIHQIQLRHRGVDGWTWPQWAAVLAKYFGYVTHIDHQLQRLFEALQEKGIADDTLVVVSADHGDFAGSHRQFNKGPLGYEDVYHIPMVARWPSGSIAGGRSSDAFVRLLDLAPTFLEAAGVPAPGKMHGRSLLDVWRGRVPPDWPSSVFAQYHGEEWGLYSQRLVRDARFKLVYNGQDRDELYDLERDPFELKNVADDPIYRHERRRLELMLRDWMASTDDVLYRWASLLLGNGDR
jgi:arylsulfatase A-like enzyme